MNYLSPKLGNISGGKILDVATYSGDFIDKLIKAFKDFESAVGIDLADKEFEKAREKFKGKPVDFMVMDSRKLEFSDCSFDTVAMSNGLHHMADIGKALSEMSRVLKPGGNFIIFEVFGGDQNENQMSDVLHHHFGIKLDRLRGKVHNYPLTKAEIIEHINRLGLSDYESFDYQCTECNPETEEKLAERMNDIDRDLADFIDHPEYESLKQEGEQIKQRFRTIGYECSSCLVIIGKK